MKQLFKFCFYPALFVLVAFSAILLSASGTAAAASDSSCVINPKGGIFPQGQAINIGIECGAKVTKASYRWDKGGASQAINNGLAQFNFGGTKNQILYLNYTYYYFYKGAKKFKKISSSAIFKVSKDVCVISPNGGKFSNNAPVDIKCGANVKNISYGWGSEKSKAFNPSTPILFETKKNNVLSLTYFYPLPKSTKLKEVNVRANFSVQRCIDTASGVIYTTGSSVTSFGNYCSGNSIISYYCDGNEKKTSSPQVCTGGCKNNNCVIDNFIADKQHLFDTEAKCVSNNDYANYALKSNYFVNDKDALAIAAGAKTVVMPSTAEFKERDITWRIINALQMIGYTENGIFYNRKIASSTIKEIDCRLAKTESVIKTQSAKLPNFMDISGPQFRENLPREYAAYTYATIFDLFNINPNTQFLSYTNNCLLATLCPQMPEAIANGGDKQCSDKSLIASAPKYIVQSPGLFGFYKDSFNNFMFSGALDGGQYPPHSIPFIAAYQSILVHEMAHEMDKVNIGINEKYQKYKRSECSLNNGYMDFGGVNSPFSDDNIKGNQDIDDFVSVYASGMGDFTNLNKNYLPGQYNRNEDIAESMAAYILYPEYFRWRVTTSQWKGKIALRNKYNFIKNNVFSGREFTYPYYAAKKLYRIPVHINGLIEANSDMEKFNLSDIKVK